MKVNINVSYKEKNVTFSSLSFSARGSAIFYSLLWAVAACQSVTEMTESEQKQIR